MESGKTTITLPEELVWKIFVRVPFPYIFKARLLSKSWLAKFQPISLSQHEEAEEREETEEKRLLFQEQVVEWSSTHWKTFGPMFIRKDDFVAYDRASNHWQQMPWLSYIPEKLFHGITWWRLEGALLLFELEERDDGIGKLRFDMRFSLHVRNIFTRCCRQLPSRFSLGIEAISSFQPCSWLILMSSKTYKVVIFDEDKMIDTGHLFATVYDSNTGAWNRVVYEPDLDPTARRSAGPSAGPSTHTTLWWKSNWAHLNGFLYRLVRPEGNQMPSTVVSFNVKEEIFDSLEMTVTDVFTGSDDVALTVCNGCLLVLEYSARSVIVKKIDLGSRTFEEVTRGPPASLNFGRFDRHTATDRACIFFVRARSSMNIKPHAGLDTHLRVLAYDMLQGEWSDIPLPSCVRRSYNCRSRSLSYSRQSCYPGFFHYHNMISTNYIFEILPDQYEWATSSFQPGLNPFVVV